MTIPLIATVRGLDHSGSWSNGTASVPCPCEHAVSDQDVKRTARHVKDIQFIRVVHTLLI